MKLGRKITIITSMLVVAILLTAVTPAIGAPQDTVRVWVSYQSGRKGEVLQLLERSNSSFHYDFPELEAYVVTLPAAALNGVLRNPFVVDVEGDPERTPIETIQIPLEAALQDNVIYGAEVVPWGVDAVQARDVWDPTGDGTMDAGVPTGEGIKVCIIDTGYYAGHEDLKDTVDGVTGISQVDDNWSRDGAGHGSHVAGTIGALNNALGVVGVSPGMVDYHIVKIFDDSGVWVTRASDLTAAIYNCRDNGANVISMSLGGVSSNRREERAFDELYAAGILHVAAAGNDQVETPGAISYPASYPSVISVAAIDSSMLVADFSNQNQYVELAAPGVGVLSTIPYIETASVTVDGAEYTANHIEFSRYGTASGALVNGGKCTASGSWVGLVVLCERGDISFYDKVMAVQNGGGAAAVIYNNEPGNFFGTLGDGASSTIIGLTLSQVDGQFLVTKEGHTASLSSVNDWPANGYEAWNGTSMATPHVAGVAALIWSANPSWTNVQIREAMNETALDLGATGKDVIFGNGLVQAADALALLGGGTPPPPPPPPPPTGALVVQITSPENTASFINRDTVLIRVLVTDSDGAVVEGAAVEAAVTGTLSTAKIYNGTTSLDGTVSFSYKINSRKTGTGQYLIDVTATKDGYDPGSESSLFMVQ